MACILSFVVRIELKILHDLDKCVFLIVRPIKRIVLFPVHLKQFSWVGRKVFYFSYYIVLPVKFMVFEEKIRIFNILTYITLFFWGHKKLFVQIVVKSLQSAGLLLGRSEDRKQDYSFDRPQKIWKWYDESLLCCHRVKICNFAMNK